MTVDWGYILLRALLVTMAQYTAQRGSVVTHTHTHTYTHTTNIRNMSLTLNVCNIQVSTSVGGYALRIPWSTSYRR
jgi:hypothetical protein